MTAAEVPDLLAAHLREELGVWPPTQPLTFAASERRVLPGWDGHVRPVAVLKTPEFTVVSVPPAALADVRRLAAGWGTAGYDEDLVAVLGLEPGRRISVEDVYRWSVEPAATDDLGAWVDAADARTPEWLRPFNGGVLLSRDADGAYLGGVGVKTHDAFAAEIAVGTEPAARGRGIARRLVATAAREILSRGLLPTYVHEPDNLASAHVADAAGFPDRGWRIGGLWKPREGTSPTGTGKS